jgi:fatty acid amide hydrolase
VAEAIHALGVLELKEALEAKRLSAREVVAALIARRESVDLRVSALVHRFDSEALRRAEQIDEARARGEHLGPLAGIPITIKESVSTEGLASTLGVRARADKKELRDAVVVELLKSAGAIVIGKTNLSQLLLFHEADNPIWGTTNNPWNLARTPGGSSGGEAAAHAAGLAPGGIGTDIGGSIRIPAAFSGVAGFKPTLDRWSNLGSNGALVGQEVIRSQLGPMARTARDVAFLFGALDPAAHAARDPLVPPIPLQDPGAVDVSRLRVGVYSDDGVLAPAASVARAVDLAAEALRGTGATVVPFALKEAPEIMEAYFASVSADGGKTVERILAGEPIVEQLRQLRQIATMSGPRRKVSAVAMGLARENRVKRLLELVFEKPVDEYWRLANRRTELRRAVAREWAKEGIDAVICPAHATPALRHGQSGDFSLGGCYSMVYNYLNFPAGVVPVSRVLASDAVRENPSDRLERRAAETEADSVGLPLGVQVVSLPWHEATALAVMIAIEERRRSSEDYPRSPVDP